MKVQFDFPTADLAEVAGRTVNRSPLMHRRRLRNAAASAVLAGLLAFAIAPADMNIRIAVGFVIALGVFVVTTYLLPRTIENMRALDPQVKADFVSLARSRVPDSAQPQAAHKRMPERPVVAGPTEGEYMVAWLLFFVCVSVTGNLASAAIGSGAAAILRVPGAAPAYGVYVFAGLSFFATACLSYVFFRLFAQRLVSRVQARLAVNAAGVAG